MSKKNCILCGEEFEEGQRCPSNHTFKKMCLNCTSCIKDAESGAPCCNNEENKAATITKMMEAMKAASNGYEISELKIDVKPLTLKKPVGKCPKWELSNDVVEMIKRSFV